MFKNNFKLQIKKTINKLFFFFFFWSVSECKEKVEYKKLISDDFNENNFLFYYNRIILKECVKESFLNVFFIPEHKKI